MAKKNIPTVTEVSFADKLTKIIQTNFKAIVGVLVLGGLIGAVFVGYSYYNESKEVKIEAELYSVRSTLNEKIRTDSVATDPKDQKTKKPNFDEIKGLTDQLETAILKHSSSKAAVSSAIELSAIYSDFKKFDLAKNILEKVDTSTGLLGTLAKHQLATVLFELKDFEKAISTFDKVIKSKDQGFLHPDALLKKGVSYYKLGQLDKAKAVFEQVAEEYTGKDSAETSEKYLRVLKFKKMSAK